MSEEIVKHDTLRAAQRAVMIDVPYVQRKTRVQSGQGRSYTAPGESEVIAALRPAMIKHGIVGPVPVVGDEVNLQVQSKPNDKQMRYAILRRTFRFYHVDSSDTVDVVTFGEGADSLDKASLKAMTSAKKYALREFFCIETGDDPDKVGSEQVDDSEATYHRAYTAITEADASGKLDTLLRAVDQRELLTHTQREKLRSLAESRRAELKGSSS